MRKLEAFDPAKKTMPDKYSSVTVDEVKQIFTHLVPDGDARYSLLRLLLSSTDLANSIAPLAWGVTQYSNGFRLNVGQVEAVVFLDASLHVNLIGEVGMPPFAGDTFRVVQYATVPYTTCRFHGSIETFEKLRSELQSSHFEFIRRAVATGAGFPRRGTPFRRFHCHSLIDYAKQETDQFDGGLDQRVSSMEADKLLDANSPRAREGYDIDRVNNWYRFAPRAIELLISEADRFQLKSFVHCSAKDLSAKTNEHSDWARRPGFGVECAWKQSVGYVKKWTSDSLTHFSQPRVLPPQNRTRLALSLCERPITSSARKLVSGSWNLAFGIRHLSFSPCAHSAPPPTPSTTPSRKQSPARTPASTASLTPPKKPRQKTRRRRG